MNIVLIGAQGSGKGTQAALLTQTLAIHHVASGDLFRKAQAEKTRLGVQAKAYLDRGELVPDEITIAMVLQHVEKLIHTRGILFDGFPRTVAQAQALDHGLQRFNRKLDLAVYLNVPRTELLFRLSGRYICRAKQHVYHQHTRPPKVAGICDLDGSELYQRTDDVGDAVQTRLDLFFQETIQLLDYYRVQGKLVEINGNQSVDDVLAEFLATLRSSSHSIDKFSVPAWQQDETTLDLRLA